MKTYTLIMFFLLSGISLAFAGIGIKRDISYRGQTLNVRNQLDVYYPKNTKTPKDVLVFIHGGSWDSGKKETYWWLGKNLARKNVISVIINYSLSPKAQYEEMAFDCSEAIKWVKDSIAQFGGSADRIFVMGHSAGGHLAALINNDPRFFKQAGISNPIRAVILNDGFGMDMFEYLNAAKKNKQTESFMNTFSRDANLWKTGSPIFYLENVQNPYLIFVGEDTYPAIKLQSDRLYNQLIITNKKSEINIIKRKKHIGMISQMIFSSNKMYDMILSFMDRNR
ncbi:alpha/beta hydrolase fold domain-containing protein [Daejeonella sp.]|jgi:dipeptidyl aminopeptidase/acylaminoacyl peptidase|uniref:alpha/beta hydrolase fold domain-containing protein n=1 Tax=Daejeonella sp. TaxID=2805397 RepID=UPI0037852EAE